MKKFYLLILVFLICGCADSLKTEIDKDAFGYEARYNLVSNSFAKDRNIIEMEEGLMYFPMDYKEQLRYMIYINDTDYQIVNADIGSQCDFDNLKSCTGLFDTHSIYENFNYYMGQIYYLFSEFDEDNETSDYYLGRCDLDGSNKEKLIKLSRSDKTIKEYSISMVFHKGIIYYTFGDNVLHAINLESMKEEIILTLNDSAKIYAMYMVEDTAFVIADFYEEQEKILNNAILKFNLKDKDFELYQTGMSVYLIDNENIIYVDENKNTLLYNINSKSTKKLLNSLCIYKVSNDKYYLLDNSDELIKDSGIYLFDKEGNQLDYVPCNDFHYGYGIINNKYYFMDNDQLMYYEIIDGKFQELYTFEFK